MKKTKRRCSFAGKDNYDLSLYQSPTYVSWSAMKARCKGTCGAAHSKKLYAGVKHCKRWNKFSEFVKDMGLRPEGKTLDRVNNDKGYYKNNCRWATPREQSLNRRPYSNTGVRGISYYKLTKRYCVSIRPFKNARFLTLQDAIKHSKKLLKERSKIKEQASDLL